MARCEHNWVLHRLTLRYRATWEEPWVYDLLFYCQKCVKVRVEHQTYESSDNPIHELSLPRT